MENKEWKEKTKIDKTTKSRIIFHIVMIILSVVTAILEKDFTWILCALLWGNVALTEYCDTKLLKMQEVLTDVCEKENKWLWKELLQQTPQIVHIESIKIPKHFTKPKQKKMDERRHYFKENKRFKAPIIIDKDLNLKDGYTTYLIAKELKVKEVEVKVVNE